MSDEISVTVSIRAKKNGASFSMSQSFQDTMTGGNWSTGVAEVAASSTELIAVDDIVVYGWVFLHVLTETGDAYVDFGHSTVVADDTLCRLYAGESCVLKSAALTAVHAISSSGTQKVEYAILEL